LQLGAENEELYMSTLENRISLDKAYIQSHTWRKNLFNVPKYRPVAQSSMMTPKQLDLTQRN